MRESVREVKLQSKAVVVLYRGNDFWLEEQDPNSEARDINKYIHILIERIFSFILLFAFTLLYMQYKYFLCSASRGG
jgi:hypothetical protein